MSKESTGVSSSSSSSGGVGFVGLLTIVLIALKLGVADTGVQDWSWWWVLSPLWISSLFALTFFLVGLVVVFVITLRDK